MLLKGDLQRGKSEQENIPRLTFQKYAKCNPNLSKSIFKDTYQKVLNISELQGPEIS